MFFNRIQALTRRMENGFDELQLRQNKSSKFCNLQKYVALGGSGFKAYN